MSNLAVDTFVRTAQSNTWGTSTGGQAWTQRQGANTSLSTTGTQGKIASSAGTRTHISATTTPTTTTQNVLGRVTPSSTSDDFGIEGRMSGMASTSGVSGYRLNYNGSGNLVCNRLVGGVATQQGTNVAKTVTANTSYWFRLVLSGTASSTTVQGRMWADGTSEPSSWDVNVTDTSAVANGDPGFNGTAVSATGILYDSFSATDSSVVAPTTYVMRAFGAPLPLNSISHPSANTTDILENINFTVRASVTASVQTPNPTSGNGQMVTLSNAGTESGTWTASSNASWLLVSPATGTLNAGDSTNISISTNSDALNPGSYSATLTLQMSNANTVQIPVSVTVIASSSAPQTVTLTNSGGAQGNWTALLSSNTPWLSLSSMSGTLAAGASTTVNVYVNSESLSAGTYTGSITFAIAGANSVVVPITVNVGATASATLGLAPTSLIFNGIVGGTNAVSQDATLTNTGNEAGAYTGSIVYNGNASGWLSFTPQNGSLPASGTQVIAFSLVNTASLAVGNYSAVVTFLLGSQTVSMTVTLVMQVTAQGSTQTVLIGEQPVVVEWPLVITNKIDQQSSADFTVLDDTGTLVIPQNAPVIINNSLEGVKFKGYVATVESNKRLYPQPHTEHIIACKDERYLAAKRLFTGKDYINRLAGDIVADFMQGYLTPEGVSASYAIRHDNSTATFSQGTLTNTIANNDLELAPAGTAYNVSENMQSGTLLNCGVGTNNALQLASTQTIKIVGTASQGVSSAAVNQIGNNYAYFKIWSGNVSIASGDSLRYGVWISSTSPQIMSAVDGICTDGTTIRDYQNRYLLDQNHLAAHPGTDLSGYANDQWYFRTIDLTPIAGKSLGTISVAFEGDNTGTYTSYFRAVHLVDTNGTIKQSFFDYSIATNELLSNIGYGATSLTQVTAYEQNGMRVSSGNGISGVGVIQTSSISWITDATAPQGTSLIVEVSIDNGATWQACTSGKTFPSLLTGANATNVIIFTRQRMMLTGASPELTPNLYSLQWGVTPSFTCTKTDVLKVDTTQSDLSSGANTGVSVSNGDLTLNGSWHTWSDASTANQTFFGYGSQGTVMRQAVVTVAPGGKEGRSRLDFAGSWQDFIAEVDVTVSTHGNASFVYRTTNWQTANNYHAYNVDLTQTQIIFGRGSEVQVSLRRSQLQTSISVKEQSFASKSLQVEAAIASM